MRANAIVEAASAPCGDDLSVEVVERKGVGHPDTICDEVAEAVSRSLQRHYLSEFGRVLHYNVDKVLLRAGSAHAAYGGGRIGAPMEVYVAGRATSAVSGRSVPIAELCADAARAWLRANLRRVDVDRDVRVINLIRPGSEDLTQLFERGGPRSVARSNDTSIGVGFSPLSRLERAVLEADRTLREISRGEEMPFVGEDVKIMAVRKGGDVRITLACAMVGRFVRDLRDYVDKKAALGKRLAARLEPFGFARVDVIVNAADDLDAGSVYLTVSGTSAEAGDDGEVGRGNRANGLIMPCRAMTTEAYAGKNPVSHTGRIYQFWAQSVADRVRDAGAGGAECMMVSRIGAPVTEPELVHVKVNSPPGRELPSDLRKACEDAVEAVLTAGPASAGPLAADG